MIVEDYYHQPIEEVKLKDSPPLKIEKKVIKIANANFDSNRKSEDEKSEYEVHEIFKCDDSDFFSG